MCNQTYCTVHERDSSVCMFAKIRHIQQLNERSPPSVSLFLTPPILFRFASVTADCAIKRFCRSLREMFLRPVHDSDLRKFSMRQVLLLKKSNKKEAHCPLFVSRSCLRDASCFQASFPIVIVIRDATT